MPGLLSRRVPQCDHRLLPSAMEAQTCSSGGSSSSSGSEYEPSSVCLAAMVDDFIEKECDDCPPSSCNANINPSRRSCLDQHILITLEKLLSFGPNAGEALLLDLVNEGLRLARGEDMDVGMAAGRRMVMGHLRSKGGYNAAVCKSKLVSMCGLPAGEYEYIDVIIEEGDDPRRLIVDTDFRGQLEIARPTEAYKEVLEVVPTTFIGTPDKLKQVVDVVSEAMKQSLKEEGMPLPPWRKAAYVKAKWFSPYRRTTNTTTSRTPNPQQQCHSSNHICNHAIISNHISPLTAWELPPLGQKVLPSNNRKVSTGLASMLAVVHQHHRPERLAKAA